MMAKILMEQIINSYLIRYDRMSELVKNSFKAYKNASEMNI